MTTSEDLSSDLPGHISQFTTIDISNAKLYIVTSAFEAKHVPNLKVICLLLFLFHSSYSNKVLEVNVAFKLHAHTFALLVQKSCQLGTIAKFLDFC